MVNRAFTILAFSLFATPAPAATVEVTASVTILSPTASITRIPPEAIKSRPLKGPGLALQGEPGRVIGFTAGGVSGMVTLDKDGVGQFVLPKSSAQDVEIMLHYD
jgi:hypothetical protein